MDERTRLRLFEPFFTTKEMGHGSGLGLATVYGIVKQSGGNIWVYSEVGHGTTFKIYLSQVQESAEPVAERRWATPSHSGTETVLVVEDEDGVRELARELLEDLGYTVLEARRPREAMLVAEQHRGPIQLLLTDVVMPELNGSRLAERLRPGRPEMKVLYMSGYTDDAIVRHGVLKSGTHFLEKPFSSGRLADKVREVLDETLEA
jgi:CheY-like chemotaxis protein